jgi:hypothetical protein
LKPEARQEIAKRLVEEAEEMVGLQLSLVAALEVNGAKTNAAQELLIQFEKAQETFRHILGLLQEPQSETGSVSGVLCGNAKMSDGDRHMAEYLQRAQEAEKLADTITDSTLRKHWRNIACGYRNLAQARLTSAATMQRSSRAFLTWPLK